MTSTPNNKPDAPPEDVLTRQLINLLDGSKAHATFAHAVEDFPEELRASVPQGLVHSAWQLVEHIRVAQRDLLDFSQNEDGSYKPKERPKEYWPAVAPPSAETWHDAVEQVLADRTAFEELVRGATLEELVQPFAWGDGQSLFHEAVLAMDHTSYHVGEMVLLRRLLGCWKG